MGKSTPLAFVDVETTGLSPTENRIAEIGVVTVDGDRVERWTTLLKASRHHDERSSARAPGSADLDAMPSFRDIAGGLAQRLSGRLLVAHNARFDHAFLRAEFDRVGVMFHPELLCSVMLSRKLYPNLAHHDLDSLVECHGLRAETRHRALPDADLLWQWWQAIHRRCAADVIANAIESLLAGPVLPSRLDPSLIERLPESPGAYVFRGEHDEPFFVGAAGNVKLHVLNYFRIDQATSRALEYAHRTTNITWRATRGMVGAQLHAAALDCALFGSAKGTSSSAAFTWQLSPDAIPGVAVVSLPDYPHTTETFGMFPSERKARNALVRLATKHRLCHCLLGISRFAKSACLACPVDQAAGACGGRVGRKKQLMRLFAAVRPLRVPIWPHRGPVGIRERSDIHVVDHWQFLGTARTESEIYGLLESRPRHFDKRLHVLLNRTLSRMPQSEIVDLSVLGRPQGAPIRDAPTPIDGNA